MGKESIKEYFKGKTIFLTGGTGFIGKVLLEKLLRSCPELDKVYILIRPKKGKSPHERVEQMTSLCLFDVLKKEHPENLNKIIPIVGDTTELGLGLSAKDKRLLVDEVQIIFHTAASVKFDDFLRDAIITNIRSAREAALLALEMKKIEVFQHVSTTFCNIDNRKIVEPILYPPNGDWKEVILMAERCDIETLNILSRKVIGDFPNTYTYTKQLAEHCVNDLLAEKIPTVLFRPSVVVSSLVEPFPGWIDNFNGPVGLVVASGSGILRIGYGDPEITTDYVAVDNIVKIMIASVWHKVFFGKKNELEVYNGSKYDALPHKIKEMVKLGERLYWDVPLSKKIWFPGNALTKCWYNYFFNVIIFHMIPAFFIDLLLKVTGNKPLLFKLQRKIYIGNMAVSYFVLNEWHFVNTNTMEMLKCVPKAEKEDFTYFSPGASEEILYQYYVSTANMGRVVLLKEKPETSEKTRVLTRRMYYLHCTCRWIFYAASFWFIFIKINILSFIWNASYNYWNDL